MNLTAIGAMTRLFVTRLIEEKQSKSRRLDLENAFLGRTTCFLILCACQSPGRCDCTLYSLIQKTAFSEPEACFATEALLQGVTHLHNLRLVHRDLDSRKGYEN